MNSNSVTSSLNSGPLAACSTASSTLIPNDIHVDLGQGLPHALNSAVRVARQLHLAEFKYVKTLYVVIDSKMLAQRLRSRQCQIDVASQFSRRITVLPLEIDLTDGGGFLRVISGDESNWGTFYLAEPNRQFGSFADAQNLKRGESREHLGPCLLQLDRAFDSVDVLLGNRYFFSNMGLHREQRSDATAGLVTSATTGLQEIGNLAILAVD